jgi:hypothetical protein
MTKAKKPSKKAPKKSAKKSRGELSEKDAERVTGGSYSFGDTAVKYDDLPVKFTV